MPARRSILIIGLLLGAAFLVFAARALDPGAILQLLRTTHGGYFAAALACAVTFSVFKALRWRYLLRPLAHVPARALLSPVFTGGAANALIPHSGELVRAAVVGRRYELPASALLGSIVVERVFDFVAVLLLAAIVFATSRHVSADLVTASYALAGFSALLAAAAALFVVRTELCLRIATFFMKPLPAGWSEGLLRRFRQASAGFGSIRQPRLLLKVLLISVVQWWVLALCIVLSLAAVGESVPHMAAIAVLVLCVAGLTLPSAPGYLGTTQLAFTAGLAAFGVPAEHAFAASIIYNFLIVVPVFLLGLPGLRRFATQQVARERAVDPAKV